jgi:type 1 glutamine amidotransferase
MQSPSTEVQIMGNAKRIFQILLLAALAAAGGCMREQPIRALLICGGCCHDYAKQKDILTQGISARANVEWVIAYDPRKGTNQLNPVYKNKDWYKGFDVVVHDECTSDVKDLDIINNTILAPHKNGLAAVILHCGEHSYRSKEWPGVTPWFEFTGIQSTAHWAQKPIAVTYLDKDSAITQGFADWTTIHEELYNNIVGKPLDTAHPLARGNQDHPGGKDGIDTDTVCVWTNLYNGKTKVFATTLGHNDETVADPRYLDLVTRGLLWSVNKLDAKHLHAAKNVLVPQSALPQNGGTSASASAASAKEKP